MPYVDNDSRQNIGDGYTPDCAGLLNYVLSQHIDEYISDNGLNYQTLNDISGVLTNLNLEVYRRITAPYEDKKIKDNGDVFHKALALLKKALKAVVNPSVAPQYDHSDMD
jgi:hypothetical protein